MLFNAFILLACASALPSALGLTLDTPVNTDADGNLAVTWTADPTFALKLVGPISIDIATGVDPAELSTTVGLGQIPPGKYKLQAVVGDDIDQVISTSKSFTIGAAKAAPPPDKAAPPPAKAAPPKAEAPPAGCPPVDPPAKADKPKSAAAPKASAAKPKASKDDAGDQAKPKQQRPRTMSAKFGRRALIEMEE
ncbi:hypothetical protein C8R46DRAFT_1289515 [Mycena filopes]|nr:hypothetical protein C8R46DRAFT_1289515 [Mycena filopes]